MARSGEEETLRNLAEAVRCHQSGDFPAAIARFRSALETPLRHPGIRFKIETGLASSLLKAGRFEEANDLLAGLERAHPADAPLAILRGHALAALGELPEAQAAFRRGLELEPQNPSGLKGLARSLIRCGDEREAATIYRKLLEVDPKTPRNWVEAGVLFLKIGLPEEARKAFRSCLDLDPSDPWGARIYLQRVAGSHNPPALPQEFVASHFDRFAGEFENQLVDTLGYRGPEILSAAIARCGISDGFHAILDLGCGTGLCAEPFRGRAKAIDGVDLSPAMVEIARRRGLYRDLFVGELAAVMRERLSGPYDLALAGDLFIYIGDPRETFAALRPLLPPGALFAFTLETAEGATLEGFRLCDTLRYQHDPAFVLRIAEAEGFRRLHAEPCILRSEAGNPVAGNVTVAAKI